jgi:asparagine synthase (glutamine-hydrolysing)
MCGIVGIVSANASSLRPVVSMTRALRHRGPDDEGMMLGSGEAPPRLFRGSETKAHPTLPPFTADDGDGRLRVALGHRRLSIIDLSPAGWQPMLSRDSNAAIVYNGEIYNYVELRDELRALGHAFRTDSDTEVLLAAWEEWGASSLSRLNGMFAFAIHDRSLGVLFCARDRFGVKPFYYHHADGLLVFASEIKALAHHPEVPFEPDESMLSGFLTEGLLDEGGATFYKGILALPAGHTLQYDLNTRSLSVRRWYELPAPAESIDRSPGEFKAMLEDAVRLRLRSDVEVGTCLSGGLDSSSIVALAAGLRSSVTGPFGHSSFTVTYADRGFSESEHVDKVVASTGVASHRVTPTASDFAADFAAFLRAQDEPVPSLGMYSQYCVMKLAHGEGIKVLLDGQGADEALAGYHYQFGPFLAETLRTRGLAAMAGEIGQLHKVTGRSIPFLAGLGLYHATRLPPPVVSAARRAFRTHASFDPAAFSPGFRGAAAASTSDRHQPCPSLRLERHRDLVRTSLPALLRYEDRSSMAFGIEARLPFLDYRLVEAAIALPATSLIRGGFTKRILRDAMSGLLPESVCWRRDKLGFPTPEKRLLAESAGFVREILAQGGDLGGRLDPRAHAKLMLSSGDELAATPGLVRLLSASMWLRRTRERVVAESASP